MKSETGLSECSVVAHLNWWISIVGAHGVRPVKRQIYSTILAVSVQ
ncbi:MAG: hypothetical protein RIB93_13245 [Coleofasciculus sp. D1-CHI-01]